MRPFAPFALAAFVFIACGPFLPGKPAAATDGARAAHPSVPSASIEPPPSSTPSPTPAPVELVGAGDIASCMLDGDERTARLLDEFPGATVFTAGDNAYEQGTDADFASCYGPTWGRHLARTRPAPGNHDYVTSGARGYFAYFGTAAGEPGRGYYSFELGAWHIFMLNSNCAAVGGCGVGSPQEQWLRATLAASGARCTLAIWHHAAFSSGQNGGSPAVRPLWAALMDSAAEVVITGHEHHYERFAPQDAAGNADSRGIRQFIVGTGGASLRALRSLAPNSERQITGQWGVLHLLLRHDGYDWRFIPVAGGGASDSGSGECR